MLSLMKLMTVKYLVTKTISHLAQRHLSSFGRYTGCLPLTYINGIDTLYIAQNSSSAFDLAGQN